MAVLDIEHRVVLGLLDHLGEIEIQHRVVLAEQHHEAHGVGADLVDHLAERNEIAGALRHLHRFAVAQQLDELDDLDVERALAAGDRRDRRLHALDIAAVIGAPDVDHVDEAAVELGLVVGDVGGEIRVAAVGLQQRTVDVVAELRRLEQRLLAIFPILVDGALRPWQPALIDKAPLAQIVDRGRHLVAVAGLQRALGEEHLVGDVEGGEIIPDHLHHHGDGLGPHQRQPLRLGLRQQRVAVLLRQRRANRLEIVAGIKPFRNLANALAQRLAVTQECRTRQHVHLGAGVVDVVFARDGVAGEIQQARQRVAEHGAAAVADMHRTGRIGRDVFDIDLFAGTDAAAAVGRAGIEHRAQGVGPCRGFQGQVDEAGTGHLHHRDQVVGAQLRREGLGEIARLGLGFLGQHHSGIGRHVAMARILRRLDHHAREVGARGQRALGGKRAADRVHARQHVGENVRRSSGIGHVIQQSRSTAGGSNSAG